MHMFNKASRYKMFWYVLARVISKHEIVIMYSGDPYTRHSYYRSIWIADTLVKQSKSKTHITLLTTPNLDPGKGSYIMSQRHDISSR